MNNPSGAGDVHAHGDGVQYEDTTGVSAEVAEILKLKPDPELDNFLTQVDHITDVIKSLASSDPTEQERGMRRADILLHGDGEIPGLDFDDVKCQVKSDRSVINKIPDEPKLGQGETDPNAWMKMVEQDAKERSKQRKIRKTKSDEYRKNGNILFKDQSYAEALFNYNEVNMQIDEINKVTMLALRNGNVS
jgi:hypothetical protein